MVFLRRYEESGGPFQRKDDDLAGKEKNASLWIAAAFTMIGFTLGRADGRWPLPREAVLQGGSIPMGQANKAHKSSLLTWWDAIPPR